MDLTEAEDIGGKNTQKNYRWRFSDIVQEAEVKTISKKKNAKKQNGCLGRPYN